MMDDIKQVRIHTIVNNGITVLQSDSRMSEDEFNDVIDINLG